MARRSTRLTPLSESIAASTSADRRREQLDDARAGGPRSTSQQATEDADGSVLDTEARPEGSGLQGSAFTFLDEAVAEREAARDPNPGVDEPAKPEDQGIGSGATSDEVASSGGGADDVSSSGGVADPTAESGGSGGDGSIAAEIAARSARPTSNPVADTSDAPANPLADVASFGRRGTGSQTNPKAEGLDDGPSVEDGAATLAFHREFESFRFNTGDDTGTAQPDGSVVFGSDEFRVIVNDDSFIFEGPATTAAGVITDDGTFALVEVDNKTGDVVTELAENSSGSESTLTRTEPDGASRSQSTVVETQPDGSTKTTKSTTTTTAPTDSGATTTDPAQPVDDFVDLGFVRRTGTSPTGTGGQGGDTDPTDDDPVFEASPGAPVPDLKDSLIGDPGVEPDFGGGAAVLANPGADSQGAGSVTPTDDAADPLGPGPEDDPLDGGTDPLEPSADDGTTDAADLVVPGLTAVIDNPAAITDDDVALAID